MRKTDLYFPVLWTEGYDALGYAIIEQAVEDYKSLRNAGIAKNGKLDPRWQEGWPPRVVVGGCRTPGEVLVLLYWLQGPGLAELLEILDTKIERAAILRGLGICQE
ncbi:MAG: hypothetical protein PHX05_00165 [Acidobacteriota bacterium]|nr:hypothetical protein [Acidobacteriota bacterium]